MQSDERLFYFFAIIIIMLLFSISLPLYAELITLII